MCCVVRCVHDDSLLDMLDVQVRRLRRRHLKWTMMNKGLCSGPGAFGAGSIMKAKLMACVHRNDDAGTASI